MRDNPEYYNLWLDFGDGGLPERLPDGEPGTLNARLLEWQRAFLEDGDQEAFARLWNGFAELCGRIVRRELRLRRFFLNEDEVQYRADIACEYVMRRYRLWRIRRGRNYVVRNFVSAAYSGVLHALYSECENDRFADLCRRLDGKRREDAELVIRNWEE